MLRTLGVLVSVLTVVSCAGSREPPPIQLDPSSPEAPEAPPPAASTTLTPEAPQTGGATEQAPSAHEGHAGHGAQAGSAQAAPEAGSALYACPMHPEVTDTKPSRCPKCGMTLVPVKTGGPPQQSAPDAHAGHGAPPAAAK